MVAFVLLVVACGGDGDRADGVTVDSDTVDSDTVDSDTINGVTVEAAGDQEGEALGDRATPMVNLPDEIPPSPLMSFLQSATGGVGDPGLQATIYADELADCMQAEGLQYVAYVPDSTDAEPLDDGTRLEEGSLDWVRRYGFGISTLEFTQAQVGDELVGHPGARLRRPIAADPNYVYYQSLPEDERTAFDRAAYGTAADPGCIEIASDASWGNPDVQQRLIDSFESELLALDLQVDSDPRVIAFEDGLRNCATAKGFDFVDFDTTYDQIDAQLQPIRDHFPGGGTETDAESEDEPRTEEASLSREQLEDLSEIQRNEVALALAVYDCGSLATLDDLREYILVELEQDFVESNEGAMVAMLERLSAE